MFFIAEIDGFDMMQLVLLPALTLQQNPGPLRYIVVHVCEQQQPKKTRKKGSFQQRTRKAGNTLRSLEYNFSGKRGWFCQI